jgi:3-oxoadipate enol-lactonase
MDYREQLHRVQVPTLVIAGAHDPSTPPSDGRFLADHIRGAKFTELPAAHLSNIEASEQFNHEILAFLQSQGAHG